MYRRVSKNLTNIPQACRNQISSSSPAGPAWGKRPLPLISPNMPPWKRECRLTSSPRDGQGTTRHENAGFNRQGGFPKGSAKDSWGSGLAELTMAAGSLSEAPMFIDDTPAITVLEMKAKARRLKAELGLGLVIVDYLQLMRSSSSKDSREQEISEISRSLKALAKELHVPVVALSQLNRKVEDRPTAAPRWRISVSRVPSNRMPMSSLLFTGTRSITNRKTNAEKGIAEVIIAKQRNGPTGTIKLAFLEKFTSFENLARTDE